MKKLKSGFKKILNDIEPYHVGIIIPFIISTFILKEASKEIQSTQYTNFYVLVFSFYLLYESIFNTILWTILDHAIKTEKTFRCTYNGRIIFDWSQKVPTIASQVYLEQKISGFRSALFLLKVLSLFVSMIIGFSHHYIIYGLSIILYLFTYFAIYERSKTFCIKFPQYLQQ
jgi:hypothetical protein